MVGKPPVLALKAVSLSCSLCCAAVIPSPPFAEEEEAPPFELPVPVLPPLATPVPVALFAALLILSAPSNKLSSCPFPSPPIQKSHCIRSPFTVICLVQNISTVPQQKVLEACGCLCTAASQTYFAPMHEQSWLLLFLWASPCNLDLSEERMFLFSCFALENVSSTSNICFLCACLDTASDARIIPAAALLSD